MKPEEIIPGEPLQHILQKEWVLVLSVSDIPGSAQKVICRTKKLKEVEFYSFELEPLARKDFTNRAKR